MTKASTDSDNSVKPSGPIRALQLAGLAVASGCVFVWWLRAPVLDSVDVQEWRAVGALGAGVIGGIGVVVIGSWLRVSIAVALGLVVGAAWAEFRLTDVRAGFIDSLVDGVSNFGQDLLAPGVAAALVGALVTQAVLSKIARHQRAHYDS